jgi:hypothetical protein
MENVSNMTFDERLKIHKQEVISKSKSKLVFPKPKHIGKGQGTWVLRELFESPAFISLRGVAAQMLIYVLGKREFKKTNKGRICVNANELKLSYVELSKLGITQPRATRGFDELLAKGFINLEYHGGGCQKDQSIYSLSNQYLLWRKGTVFSERPNVLRKGFQNGNKRQIQHTKA